MNAFCKSTTLLLAALAAPLASRAQADNDHNDAKRTRKGPAAVQPSAKMPSGPQRQIVNPPVSKPVGGVKIGQAQPVQKLNQNAAKLSGGTFVPQAIGGNVRKPVVDKPIQKPALSVKQSEIKTVPALGKIRTPEISTKPTGPSRMPADLSRPALDLSHKPGKLIDPKQPGKVIDPGFNTKGPKLDLHGNKKLGTLPAGPSKPQGPGKGLVGPVKLADGHKLHIAQPGNTLADRLKKGDFHKLVDSKIAKNVDLKKQFELHQHGDLARRLNLGQQLSLHGGWQKRFCGPIDPHFTQHCFSSCYCGPSFYPGYCWFPQWSPWVNWCWSYNCLPVCDPRPIYCRPICYDPCLPWVSWSYPVWNPMPVVVCGTWVDVPTVVVDAGYDVQLLAVRFVDPGHPEQKIGPRYRVWLRNNSPVAISQPFNMLAYASNDREPGVGLPEVGLRIQGMEAGQIQSIDLRLPFESNALGHDAEGKEVPFQFLHLIADSHREIPEAFEENNGAVLARGDILPVDPALFAADSEQLSSGSVINVAGEGFGPEPGQVLLNVGGLELQAEVVGWYDLGVQIRLPALTLTSDAAAELVVVRGDQAASNPLTINLSAATNATQTTAFQSP